MIEKILSDISEDKYQNFSTTSNKFKTDLWKFFFEPHFLPMTAIEFGTHKGQTTRILAHLFKTVYTVNIDAKHLHSAQEFNRDLDNIVYIPFDLYSHDYTVQPVSVPINVFFIDAGHELYHVESDMARALHMNLADEVYFVFDDYGMMPGVKAVIDTYLESGILTVVATIGHEPGHSFGGNPPRVLTASEGLICTLDKSKIEYE